MAYLPVSLVHQHHVGPQRNQQRHRIPNRRAIGHVAAQRAGVAHRQAGKPVGKGAQLGALGHQRGKSVRQRHGGANGHVVRVVFHPTQLLHLGHVQHFAELHVHLGHPQAHVRTTGHYLSIRVRSPGRQQGRQIFR